MEGNPQKMMSTSRTVRLVVLAAMPLLLSACLMDDENPTAAGLSISITNLGDVAVVETSDISISLFGTATSEDAITSVSWKNDRGGKGKAAGTENWATGRIILQTGRNQITLTANDALGNTSTKTVSVDRDGNTAAGGGNSSSGSATVSWRAPTERTDNSALTNLAGHRIQYGLSSGTFNKQVTINNPSVDVYVVENLSSGTWKFRIRAFDATGQLSNASVTGIKTIP
jgi:hypothetical protein